LSTPAGLLRRFDDDGAAGSQGRADLARRRQRREIPRRERGDDADRLLHHELARTLGAAGDDAAIGAAAFLGEPFDDVGGDEDLAARLGKGLALLLGEDARHRVMALAQKVGGLTQDFCPVVGRGSPPDQKTLLGRIERAVEVRAAGVRELRERLLGRRIDDLLALAAAAVQPSTVDVETEFRIHGQPPCKCCCDR
jgi:hypothetical protein